MLEFSHNNNNVLLLRIFKRNLVTEYFILCYCSFSSAAVNSEGIVVFSSVCYCGVLRNYISTRWIGLLQPDSTELGLEPAPVVCL